MSRNRPADQQPPQRLGFVPIHLVPFIITMHTGQDIGETIRTFIENHRHDGSTEGHIITATGDISNPTIDIRGSPTTFEGLYSIATLRGHCTIRNDEHVQLDHLVVTFQPHDRVIGGTVVGPLIAGCAVQVTLALVSEANGGN